MSTSRVAIVHDYLTQTGGAERVALAFAETFPKSPIYTSIYQPDLTFPEFKNYEVRASRLQSWIPDGKFRYAAPLFGRAFREFDLSAFDVVVVSTSGFAHHVRHGNAFIYCHTPPHFIYDLGDYLSNPLLRGAVKAALPTLRMSDQRAAGRHSNYAANSQQTARQISTVYGKQSSVIYPPFNTSHLPRELSPLPLEPRALVVARLMPYKRFDVAIRACEKAHIPLTIVGIGPDETRLRGIAGEMTTFLGRLTDDNVADAFATHSLVLMPGIEDFGFAPLDANYAGRPVVAVNAGGAQETVVDGETGVLVDGHVTDDWVHGIQRAFNLNWNPESLRQSTKAFQLASFQRAIRNWIG